MSVEVIGTGIIHSTGIVGGGCGLTCNVGTAVVSAHVPAALYGPVHFSSRSVGSEVNGKRCGVPT